MIDLDLKAMRELIPTQEVLDRNYVVLQGSFYKEWFDKYLGEATKIIDQDHKQYLKTKDSKYDLQSTWIHTNITTFVIEGVIEIIAHIDGKPNRHLARVVIEGEDKGVVKFYMLSELYHSLVALFPQFPFPEKPTKPPKADWLADTDKSPLGLKPRHIMVHIRNQEIIDAVKRYHEFDKVIPIEWIEEYNDNCSLIKKLKDDKKRVG